MVGFEANCHNPINFHHQSIHFQSILGRWCLAKEFEALQDCRSHCNWSLNLPFGSTAFEFFIWYLDVLSRWQHRSLIIKKWYNVISAYENDNTIMNVFSIPCHLTILSCKLTWFYSKLRHRIHRTHRSDIWAQKTFIWRKVLQ